MAPSDGRAARTGEHLREAWHRPGAQGWSAQGANSLFDSRRQSYLLGLDLATVFTFNKKMLILRSEFQILY